MQIGTKPGQKAPSLEGVASGGDPFRLQEDSGDRLLLFYRSGRCDLCELRLRELQEHLPDYSALGIRPYALTPDTPEQAAQTSARVGADFTLVSVDDATADAWGLARPDTTGRGTLLAAYLLDADDIVRYARRSTSAADRIADAELITLLEQRARGE